MAAITRRQADILRAILPTRRLHVRGIADKLGSPNRLSGDLVELVQKRCLHMEREGREHVYTITKLGLRCLLKYDEYAAGASISSLELIRQAAPDLFKEVDAEVHELKMAVRMLQEQRRS